MLGDGRGLQDVVMKDLDDHVGKVLARLDELGIRENTIVVFTSDNGPETLTWPDGGTTPFHGEKGTTWEGGFRVPAIIRWPGKVPEGRVANGIFSGMDWMPTLVAAAGGPDDLPAELLTGYQATRSIWMATTSCPISPVAKKAAATRSSTTKAPICRPSGTATGKRILLYSIMAGLDRKMS